MSKLLQFFLDSKDANFNFFNNKCSGNKLDLSAGAIDCKFLSEECLRYLPAYLKRNPHITEVSLKNQASFNNQDYDYIAIKLAELPQLVSINMTNFSIGDVAVSALLKHPNLQKLNVAMNLRVTDKSVTRLMQLSLNSKLISINFNACKIDKKYIDAAKDKLKNRIKVICESVAHSDDRLYELSVKLRDQLVIGICKEALIALIGFIPAQQLMQQELIYENQNVYFLNDDLDEYKQNMLIDFLNKHVSAVCKMEALINTGMNWLSHMGYIASIFMIGEYLEFPKALIFSVIAVSYLSDDVLYRGLVQCSEFIEQCNDSSKFAL